MDKEQLEDILKKTFENKQEVLLVGKQSKLYINTKGEPVFLENVSLPGLLIISYENETPFKVETLGKPNNYTHYSLGSEIRVHESKGFAIVYKEIIAIDFLREIYIIK